MGDLIGQALALIAENPGIRTSQLADKMGLTRNYVLRLMRWLTGYNVIADSEGGWAVASNEVSVSESSNPSSAPSGPRGG